MATQIDLNNHNYFNRDGKLFDGGSLKGKYKFICYYFGAEWNKES